MLPTHTTSYMDSNTLNMSYRMCTLILPTLKDENIGISSVIHAGSQYEYTALPGNSDFDLQFCINLAHCNPRPKGVRCVWEGWISVEGGPPNLLDDTGDLASSKVSPQQHYVIM